MKKFLGILLGVMLCVGFSGPVLAEFDVEGELNKEKDVTVDIDVDIDKDIDIDVWVALWTPYAAEAEVVLNQAYELDDMEFFDGMWFDNLNPVYDSMDGSILNNTGIVGVNQAAGDLVNQANAVAAAVVWGRGYILADGIPLEGENDPNYNYPYAEAQASAEQENEIPGIYVETSSYNQLINSIGGNYGIVGVNQSAGSLNNQINAVALAAGLDGVGVALAETDLGQEIEVGFLDEYAVQKFDSISGSINGNHGIVGVNQSSGYLNNQANMISISAAHPKPW
jgi:hypothetical protein